ncbi:MAG TPA: RNA polymerase sigma factor [Chitinophagaceae bacterium]|nr:RNA polymerase sigma factor [Chitinophagaceae bacterium]
MKNKCPAPEKNRDRQKNNHLQPQKNLFSLLLTNCMIHPHTDTKYIQALADNNTELLKEIYSRFARKIKLLVVQNSGTEADAEDIMQEALEAIYHKAASGNFVLTCPFEALLYAISKNLWLMQLRKKNRQPVTYTGDEQYQLSADTFKEAEAIIKNNERRQLLEKKFETLGEGCKKLLELAWSGKPLEEVAALLNNTYAYIRKKKSECMGKLAELIKQSPEYKILLW